MNIETWGLKLNRGKHGRHRDLSNSQESQLSQMMSSNREKTVRENIPTVGYMQGL